MARERLGEILIRAGLLDQASLDRALGEQQRWGGPLGRYLVEMKMISEETLVRALSTQYKLPAVALDPPRLNVAVGRLIPREICERNSVICFRADPQHRFLDVAISDPSNLDGLEEVRVATRCNVRPHIAAPSVIDKAINLVFYGDLEVAGNLALSPDSPLRDEPRTSELIRGGPPPLSAAAQARRPRPTPDDVAPTAMPGPPRRGPGPTPIDLQPLELQISPSKPEPPPLQRTETSSSRNTAQSLKPTEAPDEGFHITLDMPAVDKDLARTQTGLEERIAFLEAVHARDAAILEGLLEVLTKRGVLTREEVRRIIINK